MKAIHAAANAQIFKTPGYLFMATEKRTGPVIGIAIDANGTANKGKL